jgi:hypothetical protein
MIMSKEYQAERYWDPMYGCPTRNDVFDMYLKTFTAKENYTDELGNEIQVRDGTMGIEDIVIDIKPLDQDEIDLFKEQVNRASKVWSYDASLFDIIGEEVGAYFAGDKTLDETASLIQNRAQTYIQENK